MFGILTFIIAEYILIFIVMRKIIMRKLEIKNIFLARILEISIIIVGSIIVFPNSVFAGSPLDTEVRWENFPVFLLSIFALYFISPDLRDNDKNRDSYTRLIICTIILCFCIAYFIKY